MTGVLAGLPSSVDGGIETGHMWECPQLVGLPGGDVLVFAPLDWERLRRLPVLTVAAHDGEFAGKPMRYDHGTEFYAPSVLRESEHGPILWGWSEEGRDHGWAIEDDWFGVTTLPRVVSRRPSGELLSAPVPAMESLRGARVEPIASGPDLVFSAVPAQLELALHAAAGEGEPSIGVELSFSPTERLTLAIDRRTGTIELDRDHSSADPRAFGGRVSFVDPLVAETDVVDIRLFLDGSILELFTGSGRCATMRFYPLGPPPWTVSVRGAGNAELWPLASPLRPDDAWPDL